MPTQKISIALSESELQSRVDTQKIVSQLFDLSGLPRPHFERFYKAPLGRFLALTQHHLEEQQGHLTAVVNALKMRRTLVLPLGADAESISKQKDLWTYAIFVGALLHQSGKLYSGTVVYKKKGDSTPMEWSPFAGPLPVGSHYRLVDVCEKSPLISLALLPLIFCNDCLFWLYSDIKVFNIALELTVAPRSVERIGELVAKAHSLYTDPRESDRVQTVVHFEEGSDEAQSGVVSETTPTFRQWLKGVIESGRYGDCVLETVNGHAVAEPDIFEQYCKDTEALNPVEVRSRFLSLGIHEGGQRVRFGSGATKRAFLIKGNALL